MTEFSPQDCLARVEQSPIAVAVHDKQAWLELFARYNIVEDPVGSRPHVSGLYDRRAGHRGNSPLSRFYDTFIASNQIRFVVAHDYVDELTVVRDLDIEITMAAGVVVTTPMHLVYELREEAGELKIFRLAAHWELLPMLRQQLGLSPDKLRAGLGAFWRMLRFLGPLGTVGFCRALMSVGRSGRETVALFLRYCNQGNVDALALLFEGGCADLQAARDLARADVVLEQGKTIVAGNMVTVSLTQRSADAERPAVALFEIDRRSGKIRQFRWFESPGRQSGPP